MTTISLALLAVRCEAVTGPLAERRAALNG